MKGNEYFNRLVDLATDDTDTDELFDAILSNTSVKEAAEVLEVPKDMIKGMLRARGVKHEYGQRYKEAVLDFLDAGSPVQRELFAVTCWHAQVTGQNLEKSKEKRRTKPQIAKMYGTVDTKIEYDLEREIHTPVKNKL